MMTPDDYYRELGFPLENLPREGRSVAHVDVASTVEPLLRGTAALLEAISEAHFRKAMGHTETHHATTLLVGHVSWPCTF
jgi:hypothetical protein